MIRVGALGCSEIGWRRTLPAVATCADTVVQAVASRDPDKARRCAERFGCVATTYEELLERDDVDAVYVPLPTALHASWGSRVLRSGKHLLVEKPVATTAAEARELVDVADENGLVLWENFTSVRHSQHERVQQLVTAGRLGTLRSLAASFCIPPLRDTDIRYVASLGGGSLLDVGVYPIRLALLLLGDDLTVVGSTLRYDPARDVDVAGQALLVSGTGVLANLQFGFEHTYGSQYSLWGSTARLHLDRAFTPQASWQPVVRLDEQDHGEELVLRADDQFLRSVEEFAKAVRGAPGPTNHRQMVRMMELVDEIRLRAARVPITPP
jgi:predicted dehydrogenase